jgi:hypothetical protein
MFNSEDFVNADVFIKSSFMGTNHMVALAESEELPIDRSIEESDEAEKLLIPNSIILISNYLELLKHYDKELTTIKELSVNEDYTGNIPCIKNIKCQYILNELEKELPEDTEEFYLPRSCKDRLRDIPTDIIVDVSSKIKYLIPNSDSTDTVVPYDMKTSYDKIEGILEKERSISNLNNLLSSIKDTVSKNEYFSDKLLHVLSHTPASATSEGMKCFLVYLASNIGLQIRVINNSVQLLQYMRERLQRGVIK